MNVKKPNGRVPWPAALLLNFTIYSNPICVVSCWLSQDLVCDYMFYPCKFTNRARHIFLHNFLTLMENIKSSGFEATSNIDFIFS